MFGVDEPRKAGIGVVRRFSFSTLVKCYSLPHLVPVAHSLHQKTIAGSRM